MFTVYSKSNCPYCVKAVEALQRAARPFEVHSLDDARELRDELVQATGQKTVPFIFHRGQFIGGYSELLKVL